MLLVAALALLTSAHLGTGAEAFAVPENVSSSAVATAPDAAAADPTAAGTTTADTTPADPTTAADDPIARVAPDRFRTLSSDRVLAQLSLLSGPELRRVVSSDADLVDRMLRRPPTAAVTAAEWSAFTPSARERIATVAPRLVGSLEGIPYGDRDAANRAALSAERGSLRDRIAGGTGRAVAAQLGTRLHMLDQVATAIRPGRDGVARQLVFLDASGDGRAVISIGDLDRADYVSYLVPGMFYGVDSRIVPWTGVAADVAAEERAAVRRVAGGAAAAGDASADTAERADAASGPSLRRTGDSVAVVSWIGYHTPSLLDVAALGSAREGQRALSSALRGLDAVRQDAPPFTAVLAHSYGTTAAMLSLQEDDVHVDALALLGSPGSPARTASDLDVTGGDVWVGAARWDPIARSGVFGSQPTAAGYGAHALPLDEERDPATGAELAGALSHNDYFAPGSASLRNLALIAIDRADLVPGATLAAQG